MGEAGRYPAKWVRRVLAEIAQLMKRACSHSPTPALYCTLSPNDRSGSQTRAPRLRT